MNKIIRSLYIFFFLLFFILTPLFVMYARGYRYNWQAHIIEKNGAFYVKSFPRSASIVIDGELQDRKTPTQIINMRPGDHKISVQKENYVAWEKTLPINAGETTFAEDIVLWSADRPRQDLGPGAAHFLLNQARDRVIYLTKQGDLYLTDAEQGKNHFLSKLGLDYKLLDWSADNQMILLAKNNSYYIFDISTQEITSLTRLSAQKAIWDKSQAKILWYLLDGKVYRLNLDNVDNSESRQIVINKKINDFDLDGDFLLVHWTRNNEHYVQQLTQYNQELISQVDNVSLGPLKILSAQRDVLIFSVGSQLYIKAKDRDTIVIPMTLAQIHDERILLTNGHEIIVYNFKKNWQQLIDRSTQLVNDIAWHPNGSYFISEINNVSALSELDDRDIRNSIKLLENPDKKLYFFNKKGDRLYILTSEENYYLTIQ